MAARIFPRRTSPSSSTTDVDRVSSALKTLSTLVINNICSFFHAFRVKKKNNFNNLIFCTQTANDIGKGSYGALKVKQEFEHAYIALSEALANYLIKDNLSILGRIIQIKHEVIEYRRWIRDTYASNTSPWQFEASLAADMFAPCERKSSTSTSTSSSSSTSTTISTTSHGRHHHYDHNNNRNHQANHHHQSHHSHHQHHHNDNQRKSTNRVYFSNSNGNGNGNGGGGGKNSKRFCHNNNSNNNNNNN